mmetsp:Transcript_21151/g.31139  ORF Transcript_21151/g.31139 Transcript_21151/m.31139 type:complete len:893 (-) Transcript_21151:152-2830(-)
MALTTGTFLGSMTQYAADYNFVWSMLVQLNNLYVTMEPILVPPRYSIRFYVESKKMVTKLNARDYYDLEEDLNYCQHHQDGDQQQQPQTYNPSAKTIATLAAKFYDKFYACDNAIRTGDYYRYNPTPSPTIFVASDVLSVAPSTALIDPSTNAEESPGGKKHKHKKNATHANTDNSMNNTAGDSDNDGNARLLANQHQYPKEQHHQLLRQRRRLEKEGVKPNRLQQQIQRIGDDGDDGDDDNDIFDDDLINVDDGTDDALDDDDIFDDDLSNAADDIDYSLVNGTVGDQKNYPTGDVRGNGDNVVSYFGNDSNENNAVNSKVKIEKASLLATSAAATSAANDEVEEEEAKKDPDQHSNGSQNVEDKSEVSGENRDSDNTQEDEDQDSEEPVKNNDDKTTDESNNDSETNEEPAEEPAEAAAEAAKAAEEAAEQAKQAASSPADSAAADAAEAAAVAAKKAAVATSNAAAKVASESLLSGDGNLMTTVLSNCFSDLKYGIRMDVPFPLNSLTEEEDSWEQNSNNGNGNEDGVINEVMSDHTVEAFTVTTTYVYLYLDGTNYYRLNLTPPYWGSEMMNHEVPKPETLMEGRGDMIDWALALFIIGGFLFGILVLLQHTGIIHIHRKLSFRWFFDPHEDAHPGLHSFDEAEAEDLHYRNRKKGMGFPHAFAEDAIPVSLGGRRSSVEKLRAYGPEKNFKEKTIDLVETEDSKHAIRATNNNCAPTDDCGDVELMPTLSSSAHGNGGSSHGEVVHNGSHRGSSFGLEDSLDLVSDTIDHQIDTMKGALSIEDIQKQANVAIAGGVVTSADTLSNSTSINMNDISHSPLTLTLPNEKRMARDPDLVDLPSLQSSSKVAIPVGAKVDQRSLGADSSSVGNISVESMGSFIGANNPRES